MLVNLKSDSQKSIQFRDKGRLALTQKRNNADMTEQQWIVNKEDQMKVIVSCMPRWEARCMSPIYAHAAATWVLTISLLFSSLILVIFNLGGGHFGWRDVTRHIKLRICKYL